MTRVIVDTGPLVAYFDRRSEHNKWVKEKFAQLHDPLFTCEAVVVETAFLMRRNSVNIDWLIDSLRRGMIRCDFDLAEEIEAIGQLFHRYDDRPISIAEASLVRMSELHPESIVLTFDRDFLIYRRNGRQKIPLLAPFA
jgi:predicted nucleic acid-binding protein